MINHPTIEQSESFLGQATIEMDRAREMLVRAANADELTRRDPFYVDVLCNLAMRYSATVTDHGIAEDTLRRARLRASREEAR